MGPVCTMQRSYEKALSYGKNEGDWKLGRSEEQFAKIEKSGPYVVRARIASRTDEMERAANVDVRRSSTASYASASVKIFKLSTMKTFLTLAAGGSYETGRNALHTELRLAFVK